ncbi:MAG TPA: YidB family protein [Tepidisphaeraceae bacterium]|nr:YidB family protein [Tepidisphaeraceae bacterium]
MGLLDQAMSAFGGGQGGGGGQSGMIGALMKLVNSPGVGGIGGLLAKLQSSGLGQHLQSWIGTGANQPVSGQQLTQALGQENVDQFARDAGIPPQEAPDQLAGLLPNVVDKLTPGGQIPTELLGGGGGGLMDALKKFGVQ